MKKSVFFMFLMTSIFLLFNAGCSNKTNPISAQNDLQNSDSRTNRGYWQQISGSAKDIAIGGTISNLPKLWIIGTNPIGGGYGIWKWNGTNFVQDAPIYWGNRIAVDPNGIPWIINSSNDIYRRSSPDLGTGGWAQMPGKATDIDIGAYGEIWMVGTNPVGGGYDIYQWNGTNWIRDVGAGGVRIAVGEMGDPWLVNCYNQIYRRTGPNVGNGGWVLFSGSATDLDFGPHGFLYIIGPDKIVYQLSGGPVPEWKPIGPEKFAHSITVGYGEPGVIDEEPWIVDYSGRIFKFIFTPQVKL